MEWINEYGITLSVDDKGHQHKGKGVGGGQFTSTSGGNSGGDELDAVISGKKKPTNYQHMHLYDLGYDKNKDGTYTKGNRDPLPTAVRGNYRKDVPITPAHYSNG